MAARVAINGLGRLGPLGADRVCVRRGRHRLGDRTEGERLRGQRDLPARGRYQDGLGVVDKPPVSNGIGACPRASAIGLALIAVASDDLPVVTAEYGNERGRVRQMACQALAVPGEAASPR
ncbi:glyceraldehyde-3-phosphate dehydrogenase [Streptomyces sp. NBRC 110611]|nr:glyceraldehyde-3-phosphate dehydrogenase [Streptomyces sp. NBRC 110611]